MNDSQNRRLGAILSYVSIVLTVVVSLIYTPYMVKQLGQSEYGLYSLVNSIIGYLTLLDLGFGSAIVVYTSKYKAQNKKKEESKLHGMFFIAFCVIAVLALILGVSLFFFAGNIFKNTMTSVELVKIKIMILILTFNLVMTFVFNIYSCILNAYEKFIYQKITGIVITVIRPLIIVPLLFMGYKSIMMCVVITILNLCVLAANYFYCRTKLKIRVKYCGFDKEIFKTIICYSMWVFLAIIVDKINWSVDQFVLGAVSGTVAVSVYAMAAQLNNLFIQLSNAVCNVLLPKISKLVAKDATNEVLTEEFIKVGRIQFIIVFLMASGLVIFGKEFFISWVGREYINSYYIALIIILPVCIPLIQNLGISILQAKNMHKFRSVLYAVIAIINIIISVPLAKLYGGIGTAIGTGISLIIGNGLIINIYYYKKVGINVVEFWKQIIKMILPLIFPIVLILIIKNQFDLHGFLHIIIFGGIYSILYIVVCYKFVMNNYEKNIVRTFNKKILNRRKNARN